MWTGCVEAKVNSGDLEANSQASSGRKAQVGDSLEHPALKFWEIGSGDAGAEWR